MVLNGKLQNYVGTILIALTTAFILAGVGMIVSQAVANEKIERLERQQETNTVAIGALPVIQNDIRHIRKTLDHIEDYMKR